MKFYEWNLIGTIRQRWENHVFPAAFSHPDLFKSLCKPQESRGGFGGENKKEWYCPVCAELAPISEAKE